MGLFHGYHTRVHIDVSRYRSNAFCSDQIDHHKLGKLFLECVYERC
uniref:Uncharacterized protein n=1 Tax=Arundo donax TaxID=35708 RepID=A0A0A8XQD1_ARUDO